MRVRGELRKDERCSPGEKVSNVKKKIIIIISVLLAAVIIPAGIVLVLAGLDKTAGVKYTPEDYDSFLLKSGLNDVPDELKPTLEDLLKGKCRLGNPVFVDASFTSSELTAYFNCAYAQTTPGVKELQVRLLDDNKAAVSFKADGNVSSLLTGLLPTDGAPDKYIGLASGKTVYLEGSMSCDGKNKISFTADRVYLGKINMTKFVAPGGAPATFKTIGDVSLSCSEDSLSFQGPLPETVSKTKE